MSATSDIKEYGIDSAFAQLNRKFKAVRKGIHHLDTQSTPDLELKAKTMNDLLEVRSIVTAILAYVRK